MTKLYAVLSFLMILSWTLPVLAAEDYHPRFIRNYPPGYHGMWYQAERFHEKIGQIPRGSEKYRWDRYISRVTGVIYPFYPTPFDYDYGTGRRFNLPDYNRNDWYR